MPGRAAAGSPVAVVSAALPRGWAMIVSRPVGFAGDSTHYRNRFTGRIPADNAVGDRQMLAVDAPHFAAGQVF